MAFLLSRVLGLMKKEWGAGHLLEVANQALKRTVGEGDVDLYLTACGVRGIWRRLPLEGENLNVFKLADCVHRLRIPLDYLFDTVPVPWNRLPDGSRVVIVVGMRRFGNVGGATLTNRYVGARDSEAQALLVDLLHGHYRLNVRVEYLHLPAELAPAEAQKQLRSLLTKPSVGAVVAIGSSLVNPLSDLMARLMFNELKPDELPARFRFSFLRTAASPFLSEPNAVAPEDEGIGVPQESETALPRMIDDLVLQQIDKSGKRRAYPDCGMLLMDCRPRRPMMVVCAGHGGCGTVATVLALRRQGEIAPRLVARDSALPGRLFEVVWVKRRRRKPELGSDLYFEDRFGKDWGFWRPRASKLLDAGPVDRT